MVPQDGGEPLGGLAGGPSCYQGVPLNGDSKMTAVCPLSSASLT